MNTDDTLVVLDRDDDPIAVFTGEEAAEKAQAFVEGHPGLTVIRVPQNPDFALDKPAYTYKIENGKHEAWQQVGNTVPKGVTHEIPSVMAKRDGTIYISITSYISPEHAEGLAKSIERALMDAQHKTLLTA